MKLSDYCQGHGKKARWHGVVCRAFHGQVSTFCLIVQVPLQSLQLILNNYKKLICTVSSNSHSLAYLERHQ